jgi:hypothetical protein
MTALAAFHPVMPTSVSATGRYYLSAVETG